MLLKTLKRVFPNAKRSKDPDLKDQKVLQIIFPVDLTSFRFMSLRIKIINVSIAILMTKFKNLQILRPKNQFSQFKKQYVFRKIKKRI